MSASASAHTCCVSWPRSEHILNIQVRLSAAVRLRAVSRHSAHAGGAVGGAGTRRY